MLVIMERKFVVTKTYMSDDPNNRRNERTEKLKFLLCRDICMSRPQINESVGSTSLVKMDAMCKSLAVKNNYVKNETRPRLSLRPLIISIQSRL